MVQGVRQGGEGAARAGGASLNETKEVEREVKGILSDYLDVEKTMKPVINQAEAFGVTTKQLAADVKSKIAQCVTDHGVVTSLVEQLKAASAERETRRCRSGKPRASSNVRGA